MQDNTHQRFSPRRLIAKAASAWQQCKTTRLTTRESCLMLVCGILWFAHASTTSTAKTNPDDTANYLTFINLARAAEDVSFVSSMHSQIELVEIDRLQFVYNINRRLANNTYASQFTVAESFAKLTEAKFRATANASQAIIKAYEAKIWRLRARWAKEHTAESYTELAKLNLQWRQEVLRIARIGATDAMTLNKDFTFLRQNSTAMLHRRAISLEDHAYYEMLGRAGPRLVTYFNALVMKAEKAVDEAQHDLDALSPIQSQ